jgi:DNA polymerase-1
MADRLLLADSNSLIYRGYFAIPPLTTTKGELVNAAFGFASILLKVIQEYPPRHIAACFDLPVPTFRKERDATYKATRRPMPDDLRPQFERCKEFLEKFGVPMYSLPGYEADDVIGALAKQAEASGLDTVILSGDLDTLQLVTPHVQLMTTRQGFQNTVIYNEEKIMERFGLRPDQMVDYKALKGDPTDNIAGVPGVGEKTAAKLIADHGTVEGVYENLEKLTPKLRAALEANHEQVLHSREMSRIVTDIPVTLDLERTIRGPYDRATVIDLFRDLEFRSLIPRLPPADGNTSAPRIRYSYAVAGRPFEGNRLEVVSYGSNTSYASDAVAEFKEGANVPVHYDPAHPERAVLRPGPNWLAYLLPVFSLGMLMFGIALVRLFLRLARSPA